MNKEEYAIDIIGMCQALEDKPEYRQEIIKDFNGLDLENSIRMSSRDKLRETASLSKVYLTEYVKAEQRKCDDRIRKVERLCRRLEDEKTKLRYTLSILGFEKEFIVYYDGKPASEKMFDEKLLNYYKEMIKLFKRAQHLRRLAQRYIRKNIPCMTGDSIFDDKVETLSKKIEKIEGVKNV